MGNEVSTNQSGQQLMEALDRLPVAQKTNQLKGLLTTRIQSIEDVLPSNMKGEGQRLVNRAAMYFATKRDVQSYSMPSVVAAIIQAAELGLAIDGRLAHIAKFAGDAVLTIDYKGLVAVAKRSGQIKDCYGDIVGTNDSFDCGRNGPESILKHIPHKTSRGEIQGAYAIIVLPGTDWRYEYMTIEQLDHVRNKAPSKNGPWKTDTEQMQIKTVIRRALKLYCDDPAFIRATEIDEASEGYDLDYGHEDRRRVQTSTLSFAQQSLPAPAAVGTIDAAQPASNLPSKPRSQRKAEETEQAPPVDDAPPPETFDEVQGEEPPVDEGEIFDAWQERIEACKHTKSALSELKAELVNGEKRLPETMKGQLVTAIDKRLLKIATTRTQPQGDLPLGG
jgi:recombination protein RecT